MKSVTPIKRSTFPAIVLIATLLSGGCSDADSGSDKDRSMSRSSGKFSEGRKDGLRDAKDALFDDSGAWMWLWMMDREYRTGYDQGWNEGKYMRKFKSHQERARQDREPNQPARAPKGD